MGGAPPMKRAADPIGKRYKLFSIGFLII